MPPVELAPVEKPRLLGLCAGAHLLALQTLGLCVGNASAIIARARVVRWECGARLALLLGPIAVQTGKACPAMRLQTGKACPAMRLQRRGRAAHRVVGRRRRRGRHDRVRVAKGAVDKDELLQICI